MKNVNEFAYNLIKMLTPKIMVIRLSIMKILVDKGNIDSIRSENNEEHD